VTTGGAGTNFGATEMGGFAAIFNLEARVPGTRNTACLFGGMVVVGGRRRKEGGRLVYIARLGLEIHLLHREVDTIILLCSTTRDCVYSINSARPIVCKRYMRASSDSLQLGGGGLFWNMAKRV